MDKKYAERVIATSEFIVSWAVMGLIGALFYGFYAGIEFYGKLVLVMPGIILGSGVLIAILSFEREREKNEEERALRAIEDRERDKRNQEERNRNHSQVFLEVAIRGFSHMLDLLRNKNNDSLIWVRAARHLRHAQDIGAQITSPEYQKAYDLEATGARGELYQILMSIDPESELVGPLPPQFFFGAEDWQFHWTDKSLDECAEEAREEVGEAGSSKQSVHKISHKLKFKSISTKAIVAIYDFAKFPEDMPDLVRNVKIWNEPWEDYIGCHDEGARKYVWNRNNPR